MEGRARAMLLHEEIGNSNSVQQGRFFGSGEPVSEKQGIVF